MKTLSACLIIKNEEVNIGTCLESIDPIVNEIIVVDTGSTDRTKEIVQKFNKVKLFDTPWTDHFSEARNISLSHATCDWILVVDADEYVCREDYRTILESLNNDAVDGYYILTYNYTNQYCNRPDFVSCKGNPYAKDFLGWTPSHKTRIFKNNKNYRFQGRMHEVIDKSILDSGGKLEELDGFVVHHYGHDKIDIDKINMYKRLATKKYEEEPKSPMACYELGQIKIAFGEIDEAINIFKKGLELDPNFGDHRYGNLNYEIGNVYFLIKEDLDEAVKYYLKAIETRPGYLYVYSMLGSIYRKQKKYDLAEVYLQEAIEIGSAIPNTHYDLGWVKINKKQYKDAIDCFAKVIEMAPEYVGAYNNIAISHHLEGNISEAKKYWTQGLAIEPDNKQIIENMKRFGIRH